MEYARNKIDEPDPDEPPPAAGDFGFNYPLWYVAQTCQILEQYGILPEAGGWDDQDALWIDDLLLYQKGRDYALWRYKRDKTILASE